MPIARKLFGVRQKIPENTMLARISKGDGTCEILNIDEVVGVSFLNVIKNIAGPFTFLGRNVAGTGEVLPIDVLALTEKIGVTDADFMVVQDSAANNEFKRLELRSVHARMAWQNSLGF